MTVVMLPLPARPRAGTACGWPAPTFALALRALRESRRGFSQHRLAELAGVDDSYVSRMESGERLPSREVVLALAAALEASDAERDALLIAAGYLPHDERHLFAGEPELLAALAVLRDPLLSPEARDDLRAMLRLLVRQASRTGGTP